MAKYKIAYALSAVALIAGSGLFAPGVFAEGDETQEAEAVIVDTADELNDALYYGGNYKLGADINTSEAYYGGALYVGGDTILDLGGYTITLSDSDSSIYTYGGDLTINGLGTVNKTVAGSFPLFYAYNGDVIINDGTMRAEGYAAWVTGGNGLILNGGVIDASDYGVAVYGEGTNVTVNGGEINAGKFAITGHGSTQYAGAKITVNGGTISAGGTGIYAPQIDGETTITDGKITGGDSGVEIRAGNLEITGGEITSTAENYSVKENGSGATTLGAAVAVAQHTTKQPINVNISGGTFVGQVAFSEANPQGNTGDDIAKISLSITGGTFTGDIVSEDFNKDDFVTGGSFGKTETAEEGNIVMEVEGAIVAESQTTLATSEVDSSTLSLKSDEPEAKVVLARDFALVDKDGNAVSVESGDGVSLTIHVALSGEEYEVLSGYDKVQAIYFDDNGDEVERIDATLQQREDGMWEVVFTTDHLSTYAIVGVNNTEGEETSEGAAATDAAAAPETGTMTAAGASATGAAMVTAVAVGILTSVVSFVYLMRRR